jgi:phosphoglycerate dehydrogenase-like enzyme
MVVDREREPIAQWLRDRIPEIEVRTSERAALVAADLEWADAYMGFRPPPHLALDGISWVHCTGAGVDAYLFRRPFPAATLLTRTDEPFGAQIGEWCLARALAVTQELLPLAEAQRQRQWSQRYLRELRGTRVLVVGTGEVGRGVAEAFLGLGCVVHGASRSGAPVAPFASVVPVDRLETAAAEAGILVVALPLTEATWHLVNAPVLAACRGAILMNVGRGPLVDETAILPALAAGSLRAAALDVFEEEPLAASSPLWDDSRVIISPHIAGITTVAGAGGSFLSAYQALQRGAPPPLAVDIGRGY